MHFKNENCTNITVNGAIGTHHDNRIFLSAFPAIDVNDVWFATYHISHATIISLPQPFESRLVGRNDDFNWRPTSFNLIPLDYFFCSTVQEKRYIDKSEAIEHSKANI